MHPAISYELAKARIADLRRRAQHDVLARAAAHVPSCAPQLYRNRIPVSLRRMGRRRRFGVQLWTLLHAQTLLDGPATAKGSTSLIEDDYRRFTARREIPVDRRLSDARATRGQDEQQFPGWLRIHTPPNSTANVALICLPPQATPAVPGRWSGEADPS